MKEEKAIWKQHCRKGPSSHLRLMTDGAFEKTLGRFAKPKNRVELVDVQIKEWGGG